VQKIFSTQLVSAPVFQCASFNFTPFK